MQVLVYNKQLANYKAPDLCYFQSAETEQLSISYMWLSRPVNIKFGRQVKFVGSELQNRSLKLVQHAKMSK